jgi:hypothetical protein
MSVSSSRTLQVNGAVQREAPARDRAAKTSAGIQRSRDVTLRWRWSATPLQKRGYRAAELAGVVKALARMQFLIVVNDGGVHLGPGGLLRAHANRSEDLGRGFSTALA